MVDKSPQLKYRISKRSCWRASHSIPKSSKNRPYTQTTRTGFVQSFSFPFGHPAKSWLADGQIDPSGQQELPAHFVIPAPGQVTVSPTLQDAGLGGLGGCGGLGGPGGVGGVGGLGAGDGPSVQSFSFFLGQPVKAWLAEGQIEPSGQQELPAHCWVLLPGHDTVSPTEHFGYGFGPGGLGGVLGQ